MQIEIVIVEPGQRTAKVAVYGAAGALDTFLDGISKTSCIDQEKLLGNLNMVLAVGSTGEIKLSRLPA